jgi:Flp pilus assembly protein TadD
MPLTARALMILSLLAPAAASARPPANAPQIEAAPAWQSEDGKKKVWRDMAHWYADNGMPDQALEMVSRLNAEGESTPEIRLIQGVALMRQGVPDEARKVLEAVAKELPRDPRPLESLAVLYADAGEVDRAITTLKKAIDLGDTGAGPANNLGFLLLGQSRCAEAVPHLEAAMAADPSSARYRNNLGFALVCAGDAQRALQLFRTTGSEADARYNMGVAYERLNKLPSALLQYQAALSASPTHEAAVAALARLNNPEESSPETDPSTGVPQ